LATVCKNCFSNYNSLGLHLPQSLPQSLPPPHPLPFIIQ
jgi:hypothetical protein